MDKRKILIVNNNLHIGGVQKALVNLLWNIRDRYDITLLLFLDDGEYRKDLPPEIKVITAGGAYRFIGMAKSDANKLTDRLGRTFFAGISRVFGRKYAIALMSLGQKQLEGFDAAISYLHNGGEKMFYGGCNDFLLRHVRAKKKITFLHCDYMRCGANTLENARQYAQFDVIAACSCGCADSFLQACPQLKERIKIVRNCHRFKEIHAKADSDPVSLTEGKVNVVTVARFGKEKGVERALWAIAQLGALKEKLHYYIIGDGIQKALLLQTIEEEKLSDSVTLCGMLENPYGYIGAADLLLIPSYSEAAPLVIGEAAALGTPVLSTETSSAREMIEQTAYGWVCDNAEDALRDALAELLRDPTSLEEKKKRLEQGKMDNRAAIEQFCKIIDEM